MPEQIEQPVEEESVEEEYPVTMTVETTVEISAEALIDPTVPGNDRNEAWCDKHADWEWRNALGWMFVVVDYDKGLSPEYDPVNFDAALRHFAQHPDEYMTEE